uniref:Uncharacterized protein n=1 Tax=Tanacetum cinerariifolium TaxID=118510 RepID=A0A699HEW7_TANCI|nr:hypothetical protein [Tanacetum cinerariifolium]
MTAFSENGLSAIATKLGFWSSRGGPKNPGLGVAKNLKKPSQAPKGVPVGPKVSFKPAKEYRPVLKKPTTNSGYNKKKGVEPTKEIEKLIIDRKVTLVDNDGKPLKKVDYPGDHDSQDEVESVDNDMANFMASKKVSFSIKSLLEQWRDSYENCDYDEYPYDDDMYEGRNIPNRIQDICDNLDIRVRGLMKK